MEETLTLLGNSDEQNASAAADQIVQLEQDIAEVWWDWEGSRELGSWKNNGWSWLGTRLELCGHSLAVGGVYDKPVYMFAVAVVYICALSGPVFLQQCSDRERLFDIQPNDYCQHL